MPVIRVKVQCWPGGGLRHGHWQDERDSMAGRLGCPRDRPSPRQGFWKMRRSTALKAGERESRGLTYSPTTSQACHSFALRTAALSFSLQSCLHENQVSPLKITFTTHKFEYTYGTILYEGSYLYDIGGSMWTDCVV